MANTEEFDKQNIHFETKYRLDRLFRFNPKFVSVGIQSGDADGYAYDSHIQQEYEFIYIFGGDMYFYCDDDLFTVEAGDMYFIQPGQRHREFSRKPDVKFLYLKFFLYDCKGEREDRLTDRRDAQIFRKAPESVKNAFFRIFDEMQNAQWGFKQIIESAITEILIFVQRQYRSEDTVSACDSVSIAISEILDEVNTNVGKRYTVAELARRHGMSESSLSHSFKRITGKPLMHYINECRIQQAQYLLSSTTNSLKYIAGVLGFKTVSHFKRVFKQYTGYPPDEYRRRVLGTYKEKGEEE